MLCNECQSLLPLKEIHSHIHSLPYRSVIPYTHPIATLLIHSFKFEGAYSLAPLLASWWHTIDIPHDAILVPVPIHKKRLRQRGYHQTLLLANALASKKGYTIIPNLLIRTIHTSPQSSLQPTDRLHALRGAFKINPHTDLPLTTPLIIIDDVVTTGTTLLECALTLQSHGYTTLSGLCLAHA